MDYTLMLLLKLLLLNLVNSLRAKEHLFSAELSHWLITTNFRALFTEEVRSATPPAE
nr:MAG TPA: hypothetical protein [Caudoviricetes sp.]